MPTCPHCHQTHYQAKDGHTTSGSQRFRCQTCGCRYTPDPKPRGYAPHLRTQALQLYVDGLNLRRIGRVLGIHHQTVSTWVMAAATALPATPPVPSQTDIVELDELYTFVGEKKTPSTS